MPRTNARNILADTNATDTHIKHAITWLKTDVAYIKMALQGINSAGDFGLAIAESEDLIKQLQAKLDGMAKSS